MGSSKIQEYNLDPNCGFAKESTLETMSDAMAKELSLESIAETVNTMKTTLDTLVASNDGGMLVPVSVQSVYATYYAKGNQTVCNVTGSGWVDLIIQTQEAFTTTHTTVTMIVDGNTVANGLSVGAIGKTVYTKEYYFDASGDRAKYCTDINIPFKESLIIKVNTNGVYSHTSVMGAVYICE